MATKKGPQDPRMQALVEQALASGDPLGFVEDLARQLQEGVSGEPFPENPEIKLPGPPPHPLLLTVRIDIVGARPPIWRRLELRGDLSLADVHDHVQAAFGWTNSHLHRFDAPGSFTARRPYFVSEFDVAEGETGTDERSVRLDQVLRKPAEKLCYTYDFGDDWEHDFTVEAVRAAADDDPPARCTAGRGACPPEDVGGIDTWNTLAAALRTDPEPAHLTGELQQYADWLPRGHAAGDFSVEDANQAISLVGVDADDLLRRFEKAHSGEPNDDKPQPRAEFAELLGRCTNETAATLGHLAGRAWSLDDVVTADGIHTTLRPWRTVLDVIGDEGVALTAAGWLPPAAVQRIVQDSGLKPVLGKGNREQHTFEVKALRRECLHAGLLRKRKGQLLLTQRGRQCRTSDDELLTAIADSLIPDKHDVVQDIRTISLLFIAADWQLGPDSRWAAHAAEQGRTLRPWEVEEAFWDDVAHMMNDVGWRRGDNLPVHRDDLGHEGKAALLTLMIDGPLTGLPSGPVIRRIARTALFE